MPDQPGTFEQLALSIGRALEPVAERIRGHNAVTLLSEFGLELPHTVLHGPVDEAFAGASAAAASLPDLTEALAQAIEGGDVVAIVDSGVRVANGIGMLISSFAAIATRLGSIGPIPGLPDADLAAFVADFPRRVLETFLVETMETFQPQVFALFELFGLAEQVRRNTGTSDPVQVENVRKTLRLDRLGSLLESPDQTLGDLYGWGKPSFDGALALRRLAALLTAMKIPVTRWTLPGTPERPVIEVCLLTISPGPQGLEAKFMLDVPQKIELDLPFTPGWVARLAAEGALSAGTGIAAEPPAQLTIIPPAGQAQGRMSVSLAKVAVPPAQSIVLLGIPGGSALSAQRIELGVVSEFQWDTGSGQAKGDVGFEGQLKGGRLHIGMDGADGFLASLLSGLALDADFELGLGWTAGRGLYFTGSSSLQIQLPAHISLGPVDVKAITLSIGIEGGEFPIGLAADLKASLGPLTAVIEQIGAEATISFPADGKGNLGPVDLAIGFKPPKGAGLSVDAGVISGGGYLRFDPENGEYSGALELEFANFIELKAIGLISTRMPDGSKGFSLLIVIATEFGGGGIQLGYGFTLLAVGGLIGLNRRMDLKALVEGVRTGRIESVMFPEDVVANAPRIISDLRAFFPPEQGKFLIGPMAKIGWGTPTLVSVSLGVIIEIPGNIAILGVLKCVLPTEHLPLLVLQVDFIGAIEFDKSRLWFFAQLFDSRILMMTIDGGMGLLVGWGDDPELVLTVGGFHPSFKPPELPFPVPRRLSVDILNAPGRLIRVSGYFALTSNTVQFGARAELRLGFEDFGIEGHLAFDALFRFSPFAFIIAIEAGVSLKAFGVGLFGIDLRLQLEGPTPWRAHGRGSISLLFFEISADFDISWGEERNTTLPPVEILPLLASEITKLEGWRTQLPAGGGKPLVNLRTLPDTDELVLHPLGTLFIRQRSIPLGVRLDRLGAQRPSDGKRFSVGPVPDSGFVRRSVTGDKFAMAQFQDMDDAAKLSRPAYEDQDAGLELTAAQGALATARAVWRSARYEQIVIDSKARQTLARANGAVLQAAAAPAKKLVSVSPAVFGQLLDGSSTSRSPLSAQDAVRRQPFGDDTVRVTEQQYVVAYVRNNRQAFPPSAYTGQAVGDFRSHTTAADALAEWALADPRLAGQLHVIPESEVAAPLAVPGTWSGVGGVPTAASGAEAVLSGGKVLLAGGADAIGTAVTAAALFDPVSNLWSAAKPLATARRLHSVTRLGDGRVLVAGGLGADGGALASAEIYDPVAGTWTTTPKSMTTARCAHSATLLADGRVLVAGGRAARGTQSDGALVSAELFDPATGKWTDAAPMTDARAGHQAVRLRKAHLVATRHVLAGLYAEAGGQVLVIGGALPTGDGHEAALAHCELYDPAADAWAPAGSLTTPRMGHQATLLADGSVLVTGGDPVPGPSAEPYRPDSVRTAERYDPGTGAWAPVASMPGGRGRHRAVALRTGKVLVAGGTGGPASEVGYRSALLYDPDAGTWTVTGGLATGRQAFAAIELADGRVLVADGITRSGPGARELTATAEVFTP